MNHFDFLKQLDTIDYEFYMKAFKEANTIRKRFEKLPALDKNFTLVKLEGDRKVYETSMRPAGNNLQTLFNKQKTSNQRNMFIYNDTYKIALMF